MDSTCGKRSIRINHFIRGVIEFSGEKKKKKQKRLAATKTETHHAKGSTHAGWRSALARKTGSERVCTWTPIWITTDTNHFSVKFLSDWIISNQNVPIDI